MKKADINTVRENLFEKTVDSALLQTLPTTVWLNGEEAFPAIRISPIHTIHAMTKTEALDVFKNGVPEYYYNQVKRMANRLVINKERSDSRENQLVGGKVIGANGRIDMNRTNKIRNGVGVNEEIYLLR